MNVKRISITLVAAAGLLSASLSSAEIVTLQRTYELAQQNDPQWSAVKNQYLANQQVVDQSRAGLLPQVTLNGNYNHESLDASGYGSETYTSKGYSASIVQPLFRLDSWYNYKRGKALNNQFAAEFASAKEDFYIRVLTRYLGVLRAQENLKFRQSEQQAIGRQLEQSKQRFNVGLVAITDVQEAQAAFASAVSARISAESDVFVALRVLETLAGEKIDDVVGLREDFPVVPPQPEDLNAWIKRSLENNATLKAAIFAAKAADENYKAKRMGRMPTLNLVGTHAFNSSGAPASFLYPNIETPDTTANIISLQLSVPLYSGGATSANRRQSKYLSLAAMDQEQLARRTVIQDATNYYQLVAANVSQVKARKQSTVSAKVALDATQAGYQAGTRTIVDVLSVQRNLFQAQRDYINARFDYVLNSLRLKQVAGMLTDKDLLAMEKWMNK